MSNGLGERASTISLAVALLLLPSYANAATDTSPSSTPTTENRHENVVPLQASSQTSHSIIGSSSEQIGQHRSAAAPADSGATGGHVASAASARGASWDLPTPAVATNIPAVAAQSALHRALAGQGLDLREPARAARAIPPFNRGPAALAPGNASSSTQGSGPSVFGSSAIAIGTTPYDNMWSRATRGTARLLAAWTGAFAPLRDESAENVLRQVNSWVNRRIKFAEDKVGGAQAEIWQNAADSLDRGSGDCEDYALAKLTLLAALGFDRDDLYLVIVRDLIARSHHAVLAVRTNGRFIILDNATDDLLAGDLPQDYRPIFSYSSGGRWIHGYPANPRPVPLQLAAATSAFAGR